jgi:hypothetical protein
LGSLPNEMEGRRRPSPVVAGDESSRSDALYNGHIMAMPAAPQHPQRLDRLSGSLLDEIGRRIAGYAAICSSVSETDGSHGFEGQTRGRMRPARAMCR